jgi:hypothetical protein
VTSQDAPQTLKADIAAAGLPINGTQAYTLQESWRALSDANLHRLSLLLITTSCGFRFSQVRHPHGSYIQRSHAVGNALSLQRERAVFGLGLC